MGLRGRRGTSPLITLAGNGKRRMVDSEWLIAVAGGIHPPKYCRG
jgi:hypothetical protein